MARWVALFFVVAAMAACSGEVSVDQKFVDAYVEMRVAEITYGTTSPLARMNRQEILNRYGFTREKYLAKTEEVLADENLWVPFQKAVVARLDSLLVVRKAPDQDSIKPSVPNSPKMPNRKGGVQ